VNKPVEVPPELLNTTPAPPALIVLLAASFAMSVTTVEAPLSTVSLATVITEFAALIGPAVTVTVGRVELTALPPIVAPTVVADPAA
jgi:hypothetical protein